MANRNLRRRVIEVAEAQLKAGDFVSPIGVLVGIGWVPPNIPDEWRQGRVPALESRAQVTPERLAQAMALLTEWATERGLTPSETDYVAQTRDRRRLRFTASGDEAAERAYRTHWISPDLSESRRTRLAARQSKAPDLVVIIPTKDWTCAGCSGTGDFLIMDDGGPLCMTCADLDHLIFLPSGDAALTRRSKKESRLSTVVVRWSRTRKRYERQGILVEEAALERAEEQCLADEEARARRRDRDRERRADEDLAFQERFGSEIMRLFPGCTAARAKKIAQHAALRGSGRVGRTAAAKALDEEAITRAVVASIRHENTDYDDLLMSGLPRDDARAAIADQITHVLDAWRAGK